jgi:prevent-host-death family protein
MDKLISAADAKREFSQLLKNVRRGHSYVVTSHGKSIAKICPIDEAERIKTRARTALLVRLRRQSVTKAVSWTRDELYQDPG